MYNQLITIELKMNTEHCCFYVLYNICTSKITDIVQYSYIIDRKRNRSSVTWFARPTSFNDRQKDAMVFTSILLTNQS